MSDSRYALELGGPPLSLEQLRAAYEQPLNVSIAADAWPLVQASYTAVQTLAARDEPAYGINTGFGLLANTRIPVDERRHLQRNIVLSHSAGVGPLLDDMLVQLILVLKLQSFLRGYSGVSAQVIRTLARLLEARMYPCIPAQGSVGASGDLAPLAHLSLPLLGLGTVRHDGGTIPASEALMQLGLQPLELGPKEGLALLNGTQVSTALALAAFFEVEQLLAASAVTGALSVDAMKGSDAPFDERLQRARGHAGQIDVARVLRRLLAGSSIRESHRHCERVQDPYSLRCQPQVLGACLELLRQVAQTLHVEANAVTDNPLIIAESCEVLSGGNFHAEPVAFAADVLALAIAEMGSLAERRIALLIDPALSGLPPFLARESGLNSGFMIPQVTAAALVAENRLLAHPASVDTIPTSANQEDHVSMATHGARRLLTMTANARQILAIEFLCAAQGIDFHAPHRTSQPLQQAYAALRARVTFLFEDRVLAPDIAAAADVLYTPAVQSLASELLPSRNP
jgi:histidine ammonia-lyase